MISDTMNLEYLNEEFYSLGTEGLLDLEAVKNNRNEKSNSESTLNFGNTILDDLDFSNDLPTNSWLTETLDVGTNNLNDFSTVDWLNGGYDSANFSVSPSPSCSTTSSFDIQSLSPIPSDVLSPTSSDLSVLSPTRGVDVSELSPASIDESIYSDGQSSPINVTLESGDPEIQSLFDLINSVTSDQTSPQEVSEAGPIKAEKHLSSSAAPYVKPARKQKTPEQKSRKKSQNRNAATRYRIKKKDEFSELLCEANELEDKNNTLKTKVGTLQTEIDYLKTLMLDVIKARLAKSNQTVTIVTVNPSNQVQPANSNLPIS